MALLRTKKLGTQLVATANALEVLYQVPAGMRAVLRDVRFYQGSGTDLTRFYVGVLSSGATFRTALVDGPLKTSVPGALVLALVLNEFDKVEVLASTAAVATVWASGAELPIEQHAS